MTSLGLTRTFRIDTLPDFDRHSILDSRAKDNRQTLINTAIIDAALIWDKLPDEIEIGSQTFKKREFEKIKVEIENTLSQFITVEVRWYQNPNTFEEAPTSQVNYSLTGLPNFLGMSADNFDNAGSDDEEITAIFG